MLCCVELICIRYKPCWTWFWGQCQSLYSRCSISNKRNKIPRGLISNKEACNSNSNENYTPTRFEYPSPRGYREQPDFHFISQLHEFNRELPCNSILKPLASRLPRTTRIPFYSPTPRSQRKITPQVDFGVPRFAATANDPNSILLPDSPNSTEN